MKSSQRGGTLVRTFLLVCAGLCSSATFAQTFQITVDTSAIAGTTGYVDFQLNPADENAADASASISAWDGSITLFGSPSVEGSVTGSLPETVSLLNDTAFNDYFQAVEFGDTFSFLVEFSGDFAVESSSLATSFALSLYAADGVTPLLTDDVSGSVIRIELASDGATIDTFAASVVQVTPVPLPAAFWLLGSAFAGLGSFRRRHA